MSCVNPDLKAGVIATVLQSCRSWRKGVELTLRTKFNSGLHGRKSSPLTKTGEGHVRNRLVEGEWERERQWKGRVGLEQILVHLQSLAASVLVDVAYFLLFHLFRHDA